MPRKRKYEPTPPPSWEDRPNAGQAAVDSDTDSEAELDPKHKFYDIMVSMYMESHISAMALCILAYWSIKSGAKGPIESLAMAPGSKVSRYQRHLDVALNLKEQDDRLYELPTATRRKQDESRNWADMCVVPPHEALEDEIVAKPQLLTNLEENIEGQSWAASYWSHPIVASSDSPVVPVALYADAIQYAIHDSILCFWVYNLLNGLRHLVIAFRRRWMRECGCRTWCSLDPAFRFLHWSFQSMARGIFPACRHDASPWRSSDGGRACFSNRTMQSKYALVMIKGDWSEFCHTFAFPTWSSALRPCFKCRAYGSQMHQYQGASELGLPWGLNSAEDYDIACSRAEIQVEVRTEADKAMLVSALTYDKRQHGNRGRCLIRAVHLFHLERGDRLEPSPGLPNIADLDICLLPVLLIFWRASEQSMTIHRCALFDRELGITAHTLSIESLYTFNVGPMMVCLHFCWMVFDTNLWTFAGSAEEVRKLSVMAIRSELWNFYSEHAEEGLTRLSDLCTAMFGSTTHRKLKTNAAETLGFLLFLESFIVKYLSRLQHGETWLVACRALVEYAKVLRRTKGVKGELPASILQQLWHHFHRHVGIVKTLYRLVPKYHLWAHLIDEIRCKGHPAEQDTFFDEGLNMLLKKVCRRLHAHTFERRLFVKMRDVLGKTPYQSRA